MVSMDPVEKETPRSFSVVRTGLMLGGALFVCFVAYQFVKVDAPKPATRTEIDQHKLVQQLTITPEERRIREMQKVVGPDYKKMSENFDKKLLEKSMKQFQPKKNQRIRNDSPGSMWPPRATMPYQTN